MKSEVAIGILGATGLVGNEITVLASESKLAKAQFSLFASEESVGEYYQVGPDEVTVQALSEGALKGLDVAILALPRELASRYAERAKAGDLKVVDATGTLSSEPSFEGSSASRVMVAGINDSNLDGITTAINPSPVVVILAPILNAIRQQAGLKRIVISTYQACASGGKAALDELWEQTRAVFNMKEMPHEAFQHQVAFNAVPQIGTVLENGDTSVEDRIVRELRLVLGDSELRVNVTAVRVPVFYGDSISLNVETLRPLSVKQAVQQFEGLKGVAVSATPAEFPMAIDVVSSSEIHVGRIRKDESTDNALSMWIVADSIRRGAAMNALELASTLLKDA